MKPGHAVVRVGGKPGAAHEVSAWEAMFLAVPAMREERWDEAITILEEALAEKPDHPALLYNLACMEARGGRPADALRHLRRAVELEPKWAAHAAKDTDFESIREAPARLAAWREGLGRAKVDGDLETRRRLRAPAT